MTAGSAPAVTPAVRRTTVVVTSLAAAVMTLDVNVVTVALPDIAADLRTTLAGGQWTINGYALAFAALLLPAGSWSDRLGRRAVFVLGMAIFTVASAVAALAGSIVLLVAARVVQGAAGALVLATALALIAATHSGRERDRAIATFSASGAVAVAAGPTVGGLLVAAGGWPWIFWVNLPIGVAVVAVTLVLLPEPGGTPDRGRLDVLGALLVVAGLFALNVAVLQAPEVGVGSPVVLASAVAAVLLLGGFVVVVRRRGSDALIDVSLLRNRSFRTAMALAFAARLTTIGLMPYLVLWLQGALGWSALGAGLALLPMTVPVALAAVAAGRLRARFGATTLIAAGFAGTAVGAVLLALLGPDAGWGAAIPAFVVLGLGSGLVFAPLMSTVVGTVPPQRAGTASGMANSFLPLGSAAGVALFGAVLTAAVTSALGDGALRALGVGDPAAGAAVRDAVTTGRIGELPPDLVDPARDAFAAGLTWIAVVVAVIAAVAAVAGLVGVRATDQYTPDAAGGSS